MSRIATEFRLWLHSVLLDYAVLVLPPRHSYTIAFCKLIVQIQTHEPD